MNADADRYFHDLRHAFLMKNLWRKVATRVDGFLIETAPLS